MVKFAPPIPELEKAHLHWPHPAKSQARWMGLDLDELQYKMMNLKQTEALVATNTYQLMS